MSLIKTKNYTRSHLRAPLKSSVLYEDESYVFKARLMNISEGGMLIQQLPHFPKNEEIDLMLAIPQYPEFSKMKTAEIFAFSSDQIEKKVFRIKVKTMRRIGNTSTVDQVFKVGIGAKFISISDIAKNEIVIYVKMFTKNIVFLLNILETNASDPNNIKLIRHLSQLFEYPIELSLSQIHQMVRHDYKSLEWL